MSERDRKRWNDKYLQAGQSTKDVPASWLVQCGGQIELNRTESPLEGKSLDVACGFGQNSRWLARQGWIVDAVDISDAGLELARMFDENINRSIRWIEADLDDWSPEPNAYDLIVVFRYLERRNLPRIIESGLRPGGWLIYETFSQRQCARQDNHLKNAAFTLAPDELPKLFPNYNILVHREEDLPDRSVTRFFAQKRSLDQNTH